MAMRWTIKAHDAQLVQSIEQHSGVSPVIAQILALRGITRQDDVASFLDLKMTGLRAPQELPGVTEAVGIIYSAIQSKKKIVIYGDYDADGMTSTAILYRCIKLLDGNVSYFVPNRLTDGYGLDSDRLDELQKEKGAELIVTVDCGIASVDQVAHAKENGMQIVITDHHLPGPTLPAADAIVHPGLPGGDYPFAGLCGAGVAFKLAWALCQEHHGSPKLPEELRNFLFSACSLAAIGTVADVVPLLDENRIIVHHGLNCLRTFANPGLTELVKLAKLDKKPQLASEDIGFFLGPRLNAAGRLGQALLGVELLTVEDEDRAVALATYIDELNKNRDSIERKIIRAANKQIKEQFDPESEPALVLAGSDWHLGVIGIVAGRLASQYHRPTVVISTDPLGNRDGVGSCRTSCGVNLHAALGNCQEHLTKFGGHAAAAGLSIKTDQVDAFREEFCQQVLEQTSSGPMVPDLDIDAEAYVGQLTLGMMNDLEKLAPFGAENPRPVMCATGVRLSAPAKTMGSDGRHLSVQLEQDSAKIRAVAFGKGEWVEALSDTECLFDIAFRPVINEFRGRRSVEMHLIDYRVSEVATTPA